VYSVRPHFFYHTVQATLVDGPDCISRNLKGDPFVFLSQEKTLGLQIRQKPPLRLDIGMRHIIPAHWLLTGYLTYSCHYLNFWDGKGLTILQYFKKNLQEISD
jgi:hypothetical protein